MITFHCIPLQGQSGPRGIAGKDGDDGEGGQSGDPGELGPSGNPVSHCKLQSTYSAFHIYIRTSNHVSYNVTIHFIYM